MASQAFISFDISSLPAGAKIRDVKVDLSQHEIHGTPFDDLECMSAYADEYGVLDVNDFDFGPFTGAVLRWCSESDLNSAMGSNALIGTLQYYLDADSSTFQLRLQFADASDDDDEADMVGLGAPKLLITYVP